MIDLPPPRFAIGELVTACLPDGKCVSGRVFSFEDGRQLGRFVAAFPGWGYGIVLEGDHCGKHVFARETAMDTLEDFPKVPCE